MIPNDIVQHDEPGTIVLRGHPRIRQQPGENSGLVDASLTPRERAARQRRLAKVRPDFVSEEIDDDAGQDS
jgi:hypothetical protein